MVVVYYVLIGLSSFALGTGTGYLLFSDGQADLKRVNQICGGNVLCASYVSCLISNTTLSKSGQNMRNCDLLVEALSYEKRSEILKSSWIFCEEKSSNSSTAALCREYVRLK